MITMSHKETDDEETTRRRRHRRERRRKGRILHTRISEGLEDDLRRAAEELRVPVSNLVRNVLEEAVSVVEAVSEEFGELIDEVVEGAEEVAERFKRSQAGRKHGSEHGAWMGRERGAGSRRWTEAARAARARAAEREDSVAPEPPEPPSPAAPPAPPANAPILGWQPLVLNDEQRCSCGRVLPRGEQAHVALTASGLSEQYRCAGCISGLGAAG
jgi:hypothetical protein